MKKKALIGISALLLCTLTLFDDYFFRGGFHLVEWSREKLENYVAHSLNLIPFATIGPYVVDYAKGNLAAYIFVYNIFGNLGGMCDVRGAEDPGDKKAGAADFSEGYLI